MNELEKFIIKEYQNNKSTYEICEELNTSGVTNFYPNKIKRLLKRCGIPLRSKSESQKVMLETGRRKHPTKGKKRSDETRRKISDGISNSYGSAERIKRSELSKSSWEKKTDEEKKKLTAAGARAVRATADFGSKIEQYFLIELKKAGFEVIFHTSSLIPNQSLQIDIYLPGLKTVIEVDGLSHFEPIWGELSLEKTRRADAEKNGLCLQHFNVVRIQALARKVSGAYCRKCLARLLPVLYSIQERTKDSPSKLLPFTDRLIFIGE